MIIVLSILKKLTGDVQLDKFVGDLEVFICEKLRKGKQLNYQVNSCLYHR